MTEQAKHTPEPWEWEDVAGAGLQIRATLYTLPSCSAPDAAGKVYTFFRLPQLRDLSVSVNDKGEMVGLLGYEDWVQFPSTEWTGMQAANARRIVACVNALEGIADPAALREQRDELLRELGSAAAEMEQVLGFCVRVGGPLGPKETHSIKRRIDSARAAIAKATR